MTGKTKSKENWIQFELRGGGGKSTGRKLAGSYCIYGSLSRKMNQL